MRGNVLPAGCRLAERLNASSMGSPPTAARASAPGVIRAGTAVNVVTTRAELEGGLRWFEPLQQGEARGRLDRLVAQTADEFGVEIVLDVVPLIGPLRNDPDVATVIRHNAQQFVPGAHHRNNR
jgi:metal-dependent amidase/aminoacylase/carboxypeptidase family protein